IYDLCNPPPVTLVARSNTADGEAAIASLDTFDALPAEHVHPVNGIGSTPLPKVPEEPGSSIPNLSRAQHSDGNIIVSADYTGRIKVFRQDCAHLKRKQDQWDNASTFSRKLGVGRRDSTSARSARSSFNGDHRAMAF